MAMGSVILRPGVQVEATPSLNEAGFSESNLIRFKDGMVQKHGGWQAYYGFAIGSTIREIHPWQGLSSDKHLGVGATSTLSVITLGSNSDITPQTRTTNPSPVFSVGASTNIVTVQDPNSSASLFDTVYFNTPVNVGGILINGAYHINTVGGSSSWTIIASENSSVAIASSGILPTFTTALNSATVTVVLPDHGFADITGLYQQFIAGTSVVGQTIQGKYAIDSVIDSTSFTINLTAQASAVATATMNSSLVQIVYYVTIGPAPAGSGYGIGGYGLGGYGTGSTTTSATGAPITTTDWTLANWGEALLACPVDGPIYVWSPNSGFTNASVITTAPFFNGGIFVSMPQQILVAWRSVQSSGVQDQLLVRWCDATDYTNWTVSSQTTAGSFHIPTGSMIMGGMQAPTQGIIWTDLDVWVMQYVGGSIVFNFNRVGTGCGLIGPHAAGVLNGEVYWAGVNNFYILGANGVTDIPCTVWDFVFQNLNSTYQTKVRCATNSMYNEVTWYFPSSSSTGENDSYVKYNSTRKEWDYGLLSRTAWTDTSVLGNPIGTDAAGFIWQHELTNDAGGVPMNPSFKSGWWTINDGNELAFIDWIIPDFKFGTYSGAKTASVLVTFYAVDYPGDPVRTYGPYTVTSATEYLNVRIRGRLLSMMAESQDLGSFWRLGRVRYRWQQSGRR